MPQITASEFESLSTRPRFLVLMPNCTVYLRAISKDGDAETSKSYVRVLAEQTWRASDGFDESYNFPHVAPEDAFDAIRDTFLELAQEHNAYALIDLDDEAGRNRLLEALTTRR